MNTEIDTEGLLPFEKALRFGFEALSDKELLAIIIRSGTKNCSVFEASENLIKYLTGNQLLGLYDLSINELSKIPGIGKVKAVQLKSICELSRRISRQLKPKQPLLDSDEAVADYFMESLRHLDHEEFHIILLDNKCHLISVQEVSRGSINSTMMPVREIARYALSANASSIILIHNHPSGDSSPSTEDISSTKQILEAMKLIGITLIDHIIIGDNVYTSFKREKII